ncbi:uncharacterized protein LOC117123616 [Anneissia japonica]|uniref:uncharacterized protein LOC117123616 n=1 Tax=Anneissia japonica TaxID=1529436 RepID=UPI0014257609|nr:uncharacterized protein LOC117123616 [Anneissia japonica]XP_033125504.1 uncharacterized protein LOC117123616 [Anneissia japonica]XP_033125505.1 uncharacterized protein LOC117123616 [Anneissia japonica]
MEALSKKSAEELIAEFGLQEHIEGGYYKQTYRSEHSTAIYYLVSKGSGIVWHRIRGRDELWHYYAGDPIEVSLANPEGVSMGKRVVGPDLTKGQTFQLLIPGDHWQSAKCLDGGKWTLFGCTVSPAFEYKYLQIAPDDFKPKEGTD